MKGMAWSQRSYWRNGPNKTWTETWHFPPNSIVVQTTLSRVVGSGPVTIGIVGYRRRLASGADEYVHVSDFYWQWANAVYDPRLSSVTIGFNLGGDVAMTGLINSFYW